MKPGSYLLLLLLLALTGLATHFLFPRTIVKEVIVEVQGKEKIVYRDRTVDKTKVTTTKADGTTIVVEKDVTKDSDKKTDKSLNITEKSKITDSRQPTYGVGVFMTQGLNSGPHYGIQLEYRILGPIWLSVQGRSDVSGGVGLGFKF
jgi:hypothetical protein